jgi:anaerobic glycerol-3-phosphate dehydrogenase
MIAALRGFGRLMCEGLESALQIAIDATRDDGAIVSVEGLKDFDPAAIERALAKLKSAMDAGIDSPSLLAEMRKDIARSLLHGADQSLVQIVEKEIESAKNKPDTIPPPAPRLPFSE